MDSIAFISGLTAGFTSTIILHPLDLIKTRFQVDESLKKKSRTSIGHKVQVDQNVRLTSNFIRKQLGFKGLYRGLTPAILGSSVSWALYWMLYENFKSQLEGYNDEQGKLKPVLYLTTSYTAGCITTLCTNPIWLIKTRMELQVPGNEPYNGFTDAVIKIFKNEGIQGFYRVSFFKNSFDRSFYIVRYKIK